jgi:hypothetical protein
MNTVAITDHQLMGKSTISDAQVAQARRVLALKRAFQRELGRKPTLLQRTLIDRAAVLTAKAEVAALDPTISANDCVRLDGAAARARAAMFKAIATRDPSGPTLQEYIASKQRTAEPTR